MALSMALCPPGQGGGARGGKGKGILLHSLTEGGGMPLVVRWERIAACFEAFLALAMVHIWGHRLIMG